MKLFKKMMAIGLSLALCGSMLAPAFAQDTLSDKLLEPGKDDIITEADGNAHDLLDGTNNALGNPDKEGVTKGDIVGEDGNVIVNDGSVLDQAADAITNAGETEKAVNDDLTVTVIEGEGDEATEVSKSVDEAVKAETDKADEALADAQKAAADAAKAVKEEDQAALDKAKSDAANAAAKAEEAYKNAQSIFDGVIDNLLKEDGQISEETQAAIDAEVVRILAEKGTTVEEVDEAELVSVLNAAKAAVANEKIEALYNGANEQIALAQTALNNAKSALETAKGNYNSAVEAAKVLNEGTTSDIEAYVNFFNGLTADEETVKKVSEAYGKVDDAKDAADKAAEAADRGNALTAEQRDARITDSEDIITGNKIGVAMSNPKLSAAVNFVKDQNAIIAENLEKIKNAKDGEDTTAYWAAIEQAENKMTQTQAFNYMSDGSYKDYDGVCLVWEGGTPVQRSAWDTIKERADVGIFGKNDADGAAKQLLADLEATKAARAQLKAEEALKQTLTDLTSGDLSYEQALKVVKTFADEQFKNRDELKDAADRLLEQQRLAENAAQKVADAQAAYEAALAAVQKALKDLDSAAKLTEAQKIAAQAKLSAALGNLEKAKQDKEDAEDEKKKADDAVIKTEDEIRDIIGGDDYFDFGDLTTIDDEAVPLAAGPVTRAEFIDYLWRHEGEPASAGVCTFTDVENTHEFFAALCWADENGVAEAYFDAQGHEDGTFEPDELVTVEAVRDILDNFAQVFGTNAVAADDLTTLSGEDDEAVLNCDEVLAEFFGEEYAAPELDEAA